MSDFVINSFHFKRIDLFHFCGNEHGLHSDNVKLIWQKNLFGFGKESIHQLDTSEVSLALEAVRTHNFDHPVQHAGSESPINLVLG